MKKHPENYGKDAEYTLIEKKPVLHIFSETKTKVVRTDGKTKQREIYKYA
jgi:hypothetical protein